jgi:hypothetical protein
MIESLQRDCRMSESEALATADAPLTPDQQRHAMQCEPDQLSWFEMSALAKVGPESAVQRWEEVKQTALAELRSGHTASKAVEPSSNRPADRARFLAVRAELAADWRPRNGIERTLIDVMAQALTMQNHWMERLTIYSNTPLVKDRATESAAMDQAAGMVDRFNRMFMRTLRSLRDLRRYTIVVQHASTVNVAAQQMNVAASPEQERIR